MSDDELDRLQALCEETYRNGAEREYQSLGAEALRALPRLIAAYRAAMAENARLRGEIGNRPADHTPQIVDDLREIVERHDVGGVRIELPQSGCGH